jgi:DNA-directed RNA polymerase specialized sigma24 family protein
MDSIESIKSVLAGDVEAFQYIVHDFHRPLYYFVLGKLSHESEASDIVQKTFVTAFDKLTDFDRSQSLIVWLRGIALNYCRNEWRNLERQARLRGQLLEVNARRCRTDAAAALVLSRHASRALILEL